MRRPSRTRTFDAHRCRLDTSLDEAARDAIALKASYIGSPEHKSGPSFAGHPSPRRDASICNDALHDKRAEVQQWLKNAIRAGNLSAHLEQGYPRYVWHCVGEQYYEARLTNPGAGQYKGYPVKKSECPPLNPVPL